MCGEMQSAKETILKMLAEAGVEYQYYEHERVFTIDDCLRMPFIQESVTICKNVFLCNRQQTDYYLMLLRPKTPFRTAVVSKALGVSRLSFAPDEALMELLHLTPGSVSPLGLCFDQERKITLAYEKAVRETPEVAFHPCDNSATVIFSQDTFWNKLLPMWGIVPKEIEVVV